MKGKGLFYFLIATNVMLLSLAIYVGAHNRGQAEDHITKSAVNWEYQKSQIREILSNNALLLGLASEILQSDKSLKTVTLLAKSKKLPGLEGEKAMLQISATAVKGQKARTVGWDKYAFTMAFDDKDQMTSIDLNDLLGTPRPDSDAEDAEDVATEETGDTTQN